MKNQFEGGKLVCIFLLTLAAAASSQQHVQSTTKYLYHFGDGFSDLGNSIHVAPKDPNPARNPPYGVTYPGWPTGRWCDGLIDFDYEPMHLGLPNVVPYLTSLATPDNDGVSFSVARSPVLPISFLKKRGIEIPSYAAVPLRTQLNWFTRHLKTVCFSRQECAERLANSRLFLGDMEANDIGYALTQGKSIAEARTYVPHITNETINAIRYLIRRGGVRVTVTGSGTLGCYPYILTELWTINSTYDKLGCLSSVNDLIIEKNANLQQAVDNLQKEFPNITIEYFPTYDVLRMLINDSSAIGPDGVNKALKSCCGIGGRYNFDSNRFCGSPGVPVCSNPNEYVYWDGYHFTQQSNNPMFHRGINSTVNLNGLNGTITSTSLYASL